MKKELFTIISAFCILTAFSACSSEESNGSGDSATTTAATTAAQTTVTEAETTVTTEAVTDAPSSEEKYISNINTAMKEGLLYIDSKLCAKVIKDENGYRIACCNDAEFSDEGTDWTVSVKDFGDTASPTVVSQDSTVKESDKITFHGSYECMRLDVKTSDGTVKAEYALRRLKNELDIQPTGNKLRAFDCKLDNDEYKSRYYNDTMPDFLNEEQKKQFANAEYIISILDMTSMWFDMNEEVSDSDMERNSFPTGIYYKSLQDYIESVFSYKFSAEFMNKLYRYFNCNEELYAGMTARGQRNQYESRTFRLVSKSDDEISFKLISHLNDGSPDEEYDIIMKKTDNGWRFDKFDFWL